MQNATTTDLTTIFDQPAPEWVLALVNEADTAVRLREAGQPLTPEQLRLLEGLDLPFPMLTRPEHLEG